MTGQLRALTHLVRPLTGLLAITALAAGCRAQASQAAKADPKAEAVAVTTQVAAARSWPRTLALTGTLTSPRDADVAADIMGKVIATHVERGSFVKAGAPLVRLDKRSAALAEEQARAQAAMARSQLALATTECKRADNLFKEGVLNQAEHDRARTQCESAKLQADAAGAQERLAQKSLGDAVVRAPFSGLVVERHVTEGEYVRPDMRVVTLVEVDQLRLELAVPEAALARVTASQEVSFQVAAFPGETFKGRVRYVGGAVRKASRDLIVEAEVANKDRRLRPGMFATADVRLADEDQVVVSAQAIRMAGNTGSDRAFVVRDGHIEERLVSVVARQGDEVALRSGVRAGETIVVPVTDSLRDGLAVK